LAIFNDTSVANLGQIELRSVTTTGRVQILARDDSARFALGIGYGCCARKFVHRGLIHDYDDYDEEQG
jgi:hypothetical protein